MQYLDVRWFCAGHGNVGIVLVYHEFDEEFQYYIGQCSGADPDADVVHIMNWGSRFPKDAGDVLFGAKDEL